MIPESVRREVLNRDLNHCVAPTVDATAGQCHDKYGRSGYRVPIVHLELDHVREAGMMGKTAPTDPAHLVSLCPGHHRGVGEHGFGGSIWATANRPLLREYLRAKEPAFYGSGQLTTVELSWAAFSARERVDAGP